MFRRCLVFLCVGGGTLTSQSFCMTSGDKKKQTFSCCLFKYIKLNYVLVNSNNVLLQQLKYASVTQIQQPVFQKFLTFTVGFSGQNVYFSYNYCGCCYKIHQFIIIFCTLDDKVYWLLINSVAIAVLPLFPNIKPLLVKQFQHIPSDRFKFMRVNLTLSPLNIAQHVCDPSRSILQFD